jgi:beta-phosphoglucomutase
MIKAVIYDVDGTLINSEPLHVSAWDRSLQAYDKRLSDLPNSFLISMAGRKPIDIATDMVNLLSLQVAPDELLKLKADMLLELVKFNLKEMPGAAGSIKRFSNQGLKLGIGAALDRKYVDLVLSGLGVSQYFDAIVTGDEISQGKPHPQTYQLAAKRLGLDPRECVVFEDAKSGIASAKAAGCFCIAIKAKGAATQDNSEADKVVESWDEVTLSNLQELS